MGGISGPRQSAFFERRKGRLGGFSGTGAEFLLQEVNPPFAELTGPNISIAKNGFENAIIATRLGSSDFDRCLYPSFTWSRISFLSSGFVNAKNISGNLNTTWFNAFSYFPDFQFLAIGDGPGTASFLHNDSKANWKFITQSGGPGIQPSWMTALFQRKTGNVFFGGSCVEPLVGAGINPPLAIYVNYPLGAFQLLNAPHMTIANPVIYGIGELHDGNKYYYVNRIIAVGRLENKVIIIDPDYLNPLNIFTRTHPLAKDLSAIIEYRNVIIAIGRTDIPEIYCIRSFDAGETWENITGNFPITNIFGKGIIRINDVFLVHGYNGNRGVIMTSKNYGNTWTVEHDSTGAGKAFIHNCLIDQYLLMGGSTVTPNKLWAYRRGYQM